MPNFQTILQVLIVLLGLTTLTACATRPALDPSPGDIDRDGVADEQDRCPDTPADEPVWSSGCSRFSGVIENLDFAPGGHQLDSRSRESLAELRQSLQDYPTVVLALGGHTDNRGSAVDNLQLSKRRVMSVVRYLVANGVAPARLQPFGYGESRPIMSNATDAGRARNRRIEVQVVSR